MLEIRGLSKNYTNKIVLRNIDLSVAEGEILCLLGASGSGKTSLLRCIAGLEPLEQGGVFWNDEDLASVPLSQRGVGLVFQDYALFDHLNVAGNISFGLEAMNLGRQMREEQVQQLLRLVGLQGYEERYVQELSGGEKQRVALARSLATRPRVLLLDEPLGALDSSLRSRLAAELKSLLKKANITCIYVTHDHEEAFSVADRVAIMNRGRIEQVDTPYSLYMRPATEYVANFFGFYNIVPVEKFVSMTFDGLYILQTPIGEVSLPHEATKVLLHPMYLHPAHENYHPSGSRRGHISLSAIPTIIDSIGFKGGLQQIFVHHLNNGTPLMLYVSVMEQDIPEVGQPLILQCDLKGVIALKDN